MTYYITCFPCESPPQASRHPNTANAPTRRNHVMPQQRNIRKVYTKGDLQIAIQDINSKQLQSNKSAAAIYNVPRRTLVDRRAGKRAQRDCEPNSKRLTKLEEEVVLSSILNAGLRGVPPTKALVRDMADRLLRERGGKPVSKHWVDNFIKRSPALKKRWSRPYDRQRAACEDPALIRPWFELV
jgi:hypothetical protein